METSRVRATASTMEMPKMYVRSPSGINHGIPFQIKALISIALHAVLRKMEFYLTTERKQEQVGKYDDGTLTLCEDDTPTHSIHMQMKHLDPKKKGTESITLDKLKDNRIFDVGEEFSFFVKSQIFHGRNDEFGKTKALVLLTNLKTDASIQNSIRYVIDDASAIREVRKFIPNGTLHQFTQEFMRQAVLPTCKSMATEHLKPMAKDILDRIFKGKNISLSWEEEGTERFKSALVCRMFEIDGDKKIKGLRKDFIRGESESSCLDAFREVLVGQIKHPGNKYLEKMKQRIGTGLLTQYLLTFLAFIRAIFFGQPTPDGLLRDLHTVLQRKTIRVTGDVESRVAPDAVFYEWVNKFRRLFVLAAEQPNVHDIVTYNKELLKDCYSAKGLTLNSIDAPYYELFNLMTNWFNYKDVSRDGKTIQGIALDRNYTKGLVINIYIKFMSDLCVQNYTCETTSSNEDSDVDLRRAIRNHRPVLISCPERHSELLFTKVNQVLHQDSCSNKNLYLDLRRVGHILHHVVDINFLRIEKFTRIIVIAFESENTEYVPILRRIFRKRDLQIIFLASSDDGDPMKKTISKSFDSLKKISFQENEDSRDESMDSINMQEFLNIITPALIPILSPLAPMLLPLTPMLLKGRAKQLRV